MAVDVHGREIRVGDSVQRVGFEDYRELVVIAVDVTSTGSPAKGRVVAEDKTLPPNAVRIEAEECAWEVVLPKSWWEHLGSGFA